MKSCFVLMAVAGVLVAAEFPPPAELPVQKGLSDPFLRADGTRLDHPRQWPAHRDYLKALMAYYQYGRMPPKPKVILSSDGSDIVGDTVRERMTLTLERNGRSARIRLGVVRPNRAGRFPLIIKNDIFVFDLSVVDNPTWRKRYADEKRPEVDELVFREAAKRGYAICKFIRGDVAADRKDNRDTGVFPLYPEPEYDWATIAAWAWTYQIIIDQLADRHWVDAERIVATGHSRGGKTALCAGIYDERIAVTAPSASGSGGTGSWRYFTPGGRKQTVKGMFGSLPHWFTPRLREFAEMDNRLPVGSHVAKALIAPRGLINTQGRDDPIANPFGTQASFEAAQQVFEWLGKPQNQGLHWRPGGHGQTEVDWLALFDFCDRYFFDKKVERRFDEMPHPGREMPFHWRAPRRTPGALNELE